MKKGTKKPRAKRIVQPEKSEVCQFCNDRGYIELDKAGILIKPCYNCLAGITKAREIGVPEDVIEKGKLNADSNSGVGSIDLFAGKRNTGEPEQPGESEAQ